MNFKLIERPIKGNVLSMRDFDSQPIGKGSFGQVYRSVHKLTKQVFAIKQISKIDQDFNRYKENYELDQINHQLLIMYQLRSEYIVKVYDHFQDERNIYLVMQYVDGVELYKGVIQKKKRLDNNQIAKVIYQLCMALKHLHQKKIIHRDIKPQNIILMKTRDIKLIDFGTSNYIGPEQIRMTKTGSLPYFAPQIVRKDKHGQAVDVWCVGILLYQMFVLKTPFQQNQKTQFNILKKRVMYPSIMDPQMRDLIERILVKDQTKRLKVDQIIQHSWITKNIFNNKILTPSLNLAIKTKSHSKSLSNKQKSLSKKYQQPMTCTNKSNKSISKSFTKTLESNQNTHNNNTRNQSLHNKIMKLQRQIKQGSSKQNDVWEKKQQLLERKIMDISERLIKMQKQTTKYDGIMKENHKKMIEIQKEMRELNHYKKQTVTIEEYISKKKQQFLVHNDNRNQLRIILANLETKVRINRSNISIRRSFSNSRSLSRNNSRPKFALSNRSINNTPSLKKLITPKSQKFTTEGSIRNSGDSNYHNISNYKNKFSSN